MKIGNLDIYGVIYKIINKINKKVYIGQTTLGFNNRYCCKGVGIERVYKYNSDRRKNNRSYNEHLLKSIEKYGAGSFEVIKILDVAFSRKELNIKEQVYICSYNSYNVNYGYNKTVGGTNDKINEGMRRKLIQNSSKKTEVVRLDFDGNMLEVYESFKEAGRKTDTSYTSIIDCCHNDKNKSANGFLWIEKSKYDNIKDKTQLKYIAREYPTTNIVQFTIKGILIKEYSSIKEAEIETGIPYQNIVSCCRGISNSSHNYIWKYKGDIIQNKDLELDETIIIRCEKYSGSKRINQFDLDGNLIKVWEKVKDILTFFNINNRHGIADCCMKRKDTYRGYRWEYAQ